MSELKPCDHPTDKRESYHDDSVKCCACNCVIEQFGKKLSKPSPLGPSMFHNVNATPRHTSAIESAVLRRVADEMDNADYSDKYLSAIAFIDEEADRIDKEQG